MSIGVILELEFQPQFAASFEERIRQALPETRVFPGCISVNACKHESRPSTYVLVEHWREQADYDRYVKWRTDTGFMDQMGPTLASPPVVRVLPVIV
jgi:quinol monooxygenase YgiN